MDYRYIMGGLNLEKGGVLGIKKACVVCGKVHDGKTCKKRRYYKGYYKDKRYLDFIRSKAWQEVAKKVKHLDSYTCLVCRALELESPSYLEVHHIIKVREDITKSLDISSLATLCIWHHKQAERGEISKSYLYALIEEYRKKENINNIIIKL